MPAVLAHTPGGGPDAAFGELTAHRRLIRRPHADDPAPAWRGGRDGGPPPGRLGGGAEWNAAEGTLTVHLPRPDPAVLLRLVGQA